MLLLTETKPAEKAEERTKGFCRSCWQGEFWGFLVGTNLQLHLKTVLPAKAEVVCGCSTAEGALEGYSGHL